MMSFRAVFGVIERGFEIIFEVLNRPRLDVSLTFSPPAKSLSVKSDSSHSKVGRNGELYHLQQLSAALNSMHLCNDFNPGITIVCGERQFKVHLQVVAAVSPFFESALTKGWKETASGQVELPTISPDSMDVILRFIYSRDVATIPNDKQALMKLIEDSDFFQIDDLIEYCFQTLCDCHMTNSNFHEIYDFLDGLNSQFCLKQIEKLLGENFSDISQTNDFLLLKPHQLKNILQTMHLSQHCLNDIVTSILKWTEFEGTRGVKNLNDFLNILHLWCSECLKNSIIKNLELPWNCEIVEYVSSFAENQKEITENNTNQDKTRKKLNLLLWFAKTDEDHTVIGLYDLENGVWIIKSKELPFKLKRGATVSFGHHVYFLGGGGRELEPSSGVIQYCPFTNTVITVSERSLVCPVWAAAAGILNDSIYVVNGANCDNIWLKTVQCYNTKDGSCKDVSATNYGHFYPRVLLFENDMFVIGDCMEDDIFLEGYNMEMDQWTVVTEVPVDCFSCSAAICGPKLFILSYEECQIQEYDINNDKWVELNYLKQPMLNWIEYAVGIGGKLMLYRDECKEKVFYLYDVESDEWTTQSYDNEYMRGDIYITCI